MTLEKRITQMVDHTLLKAETTAFDIVRICDEAKQFGFYSVCINPVFISLAKDQLKNSPVKVCTVVGFPLGASTTETKAFETEDAISKGADEIDMVLHIGAAKAGNWQMVENDIRSVVKAARGRIVKVILETCLLSRDQIIRSCQIAKEAGAQFVKTSTGFSTSGATTADVMLMRQTVGPDFGVKASGGLKTLNDFEAMIQAGANRLGTSSAAQLIRGLSTAGNY
jgi:deoxyribose-phosphate aldolase